MLYPSLNSPNVSYLVQLDIDVKTMATKVGLNSSHWKPDSTDAIFAAAVVCS